MSEDEAKEKAEEQVNILIDKGYIDESEREERVRELTQKLNNERTT